VILRRQCRADDRPLPAHPYRDSALVYAAMAVALVVVASLTGGRPVRAGVAGLIFFLAATAWSWWRFRERLRRRAAALAAAAPVAGRTPAAGNPNGNGRGGTR